MCHLSLFYKGLYNSFDHNVYQILEDLKSNCPVQPIPVDIPSELPEIISNALSQLSALGDSFVDSISVVTKSYFV